MRSLVPIISFTVLSLSAAALSRPSPGDFVGRATVPNAIFCKAPSGKASAQQKLCDQMKLKLDDQMKRMKAKGATPECFMLKTYAPVGQEPPTKGGIEKQYAPQVFALRSTCSQTGKIEQLPASRTRSAPMEK